MERIFRFTIKIIILFSKIVRYNEWINKIFSDNLCTLSYKVDAGAKLLLTGEVDDIFRLENCWVNASPPLHDDAWNTGIYRYVLGLKLRASLPKWHTLSRWGWRWQGYEDGTMLDFSLWLHLLEIIEDGWMEYRVVGFFGGVGGVIILIWR